jgi:hypothetical protein
MKGVVSGVVTNSVVSGGWFTPMSGDSPLRGANHVPLTTPLCF